MSKVPCGGFKLDNNFLGMNENDELSLTGGSEGKAYQYLVTDGKGGVKWEDRAFYDASKDYKLPDDTSNLDSVILFNNTYYKVSDDLPTIDTLKRSKMYRTGSNEEVFSLDNIEYTEYSSNHVHIAGVFWIFYETSVEYSSNVITVPSTGIYLTGPTLYLRINDIKELDTKYIPAMDSVILNSSTASSSKKFKITVDDSGTISATQV